MTDLKEVFELFNSNSRFISAAPYGSGHIHDTYRVEASGSGYNYILQRLNNNIFRDIPALQENIERVTRNP